MQGNYGALELQLSCPSAGAVRQPLQEHISRTGKVNEQWGTTGMSIAGTRRWSGRHKWLAVLAIVGVSVSVGSFLLFWKASASSGGPKVSQVTKAPAPYATLAEGRFRLSQYLSGDLLGGSWSELHERGVAALARGDFKDAELALRSAAAVVQRASQGPSGPEVHNGPPQPGDLSSEYAATMAQLAELNRLIGRYAEAEQMIMYGLRTRVGDPGEQRRRECWTLLRLETDPGAVNGNTLARAECGGRDETLLPDTLAVAR